MNKIFMLARANIRKTKGQTVILALLFLISSMMLNIGLIIMLGFGSFFDRMAEELNTSDAVFVIPERLYNDEAERYLSAKTDVFQKNSCIFAMVTWTYKDQTIVSNPFICNIDEPRTLSRWMLVGESLPETPDAIYVPYIYKVENDYNLGDKLTAEVSGVTFDFTVAGYIESIYHDRLGTGSVAFVPGERYRELSEALDEFRKVLVFANGADNIRRMESELIEMTGASSMLWFGGDERDLFGAIELERVKTNRTSMTVMISMMMVIFTAVIVAVCLLVIRFRISNSIEEDMSKIGSLQSIGYTSRQITLSVVTQYGFIALAACLMGVIPAYLSLPFMSEVFAQQSGIYWRSGFEPVFNILAVGSLTVIVAAVAWFAALKIRRISPVQALRGGITTHSFKRNHIPLEQSRLPLTAALSFKAVLQGIKQSVTIFVILTAVTFTAVIAAILYYNAAVDLTAFEKVPGIERANAALVFIPGQDAGLLREDVLVHKDVWKAQYLDMGRAVIDGIDVSAFVMEDHSGKETDNVYIGIHPRYDNEIVISGLLAGSLNKSVGDEVAVGKEELPYLITGLKQGMDADVYLTLDGMRRIEPNFKQTTLMIYLNRGVDAAVYVLEMETSFEDRILLAVDADADFALGVSAFANIVSMVGLIILIVAGAVIILVLYFVISSNILRRRRELGIQKAVGYTTANLMNQITLAFTFPVLFGAATGCLLGMISTNPLMSVGMAQMGVMKANYIISDAWVVAAGICVIVLSYLVSMIVTWRIRKISAYALVTE
jgi:putative ABC transport system permease protein